MVIQCTLSGSLNCIWDYARKISVLPALPSYIAKRSVYISKQGGVHRIFILYEVDKLSFAEALTYICKQLGPLGDASEILLSAHLYGPLPHHLTLKEGGEV